MAPAGTPTEIVDKLNATIDGIMTSKDMASTLDKLGAKPKTGSPQEVVAFMASERKKWGDVIRAAGISID
jgi:tripartite-type tricarboxylate transporter receptor subunit TctC